jgi:hypothetical protein
MSINNNSIYSSNYVKISRLFQYTTVNGTIKNMNVPAGQRLRVTFVGMKRFVKSCL